MQIPLKVWTQYKDRLSRIDRKAAEEMIAFLQRIGGYGDHPKEVMDFAFALANRYGEAAAAAACEMYEATAAAQGAMIPSAEPAPTATYEEVAKAVNGSIKQSPTGEKIGQVVSRLTKQAGADTMLLNAERDGAEFAWIPQGDTCAFCLTLGSRGWQRISKKTLKNGHAEHIHANCDCQYAVRFDGSSSVEGYNPDRYLKMYYNAPLNDGESDTPQHRINALRRQLNNTNKKHP